MQKSNYTKSSDAFRPFCPNASFFLLRNSLIAKAPYLLLNESTYHQLTIIINDVIETNMAKAAIMPEIKHILLFSSEKLNPQSVTEMVKPVRTITMAAAPIALNMLVMTAIKKPSIAISREIIDAHRHIIGKTYFITDSLALTKEFVKIIE